MIFASHLEDVGNTPCVLLKLNEFPQLNLYVKLEGCNPTGSVKDRAASYILRKLLNDGTINNDTTIIESTSGNFGVALSAFCKLLSLKFIAVVDPNITSMNEMLIGACGAEIVKVVDPDSYGGYLLNRIKKVKELQSSISNSYWVNQYENPLNAEAYYNSLGNEICSQIKYIDYLFVGISSGGTITGLSRRLKESFPNAKIIAVDVEGSAIFPGSMPKKRFIPGIGSSMKPSILQHAFIDDVVIVDEAVTFNACHELLKNHSIFAGGSSGSVMASIVKFFNNRNLDGAVNVVAIFPDRGERYFDTIYNDEWVRKITEKR